MRFEGDRTQAPATELRWAGIIKFLLLGILVVALFLLGHAMVQHRFFRGGWVDPHDVLKP